MTTLKVKLPTGNTVRTVGLFYSHITGPLRFILDEEKYLIEAIRERIDLNFLCGFIFPQEPISHSARKSANENV